MKDLYPENYKTWWKILKKTQINRKMYYIHGLEDLKHIDFICNQCYPNWDPSRYSVGNEKLILKFVRKYKTLRTKTTFKMLRSWKPHVIRYYDNHKATFSKTMLDWHTDRQADQWTIINSRNRPVSPQIFDSRQGGTVEQWRKDESF